jgi:5-keto 4-deoxyuronate isomerase
MPLAVINLLYDLLAAIRTIDRCHLMLKITSLNLNPDNRATPCHLHGDRSSVVQKAA